MTAGRHLARVARDPSGSAAVEMAMVLPLLMVLAFGSFDMGNYFLNQHIVQKAVRDGARYASRQPLSDYAGCAASAGVETKIQNVTRTGVPAPDQTDQDESRLPWWEATMGGQPTVSVNVDCDSSGTYTGIYNGWADGAVRVTVNADVPYPSLFGMFGLFNDSQFSLRASQEAAVMGI